MKATTLKSSVTGLIQLVVLMALFGVSKPAYGIPAFARKYGLPCSACHEAWPKLNNFGQVFRDNGYQLGNEKDSPIYQNPSYIPVTFRITPQWHREVLNRQPVDAVPGVPSPPGREIEAGITTSGFDLSGVDLWTAGTLYKDISFSLLPSSDNTGAFHFENAFVRFDNLVGSRWVNFKFGKFELDLPISEKRMLNLSGTGGFYQNFHFVPVGDISGFGGIGDNQIGIELMGHSKNSYTRYAISMLSSNDGNVGLPAGRTYDVYAHFSQAFELPLVGLQRVGVFGYEGQSPTYFLTTSSATPGESVPIPGAGRGNRSFYRAGAYGIWYVGKFDFSTLYMHGMDNVFLGNATPANQPSLLPPGAAGPTWNGGFVETHYTYNPQLILVARYELVRMSRQALPTSPDRLGNNDTWVIGYRWYPIMFSRAGLAWHQEYAHTRMQGTAPLTGQDQTGDSFFMGFDFDF